MSLHVGGIHVLAGKGIDRARVVSAIKAHWNKLGAKPLKGDPLALEPLSVQKTGKVGFIVAEKAKDATKKKREWIAIYDSERYHGDPELARALAKELGTLVVIWSFTGSVARGPWKKIATGTITRDKKKLLEATKSHFVDIAYRGETDQEGGDATPYGIEIDVWGIDDDFGDHTHVPHVALWFPPSDDVEPFVTCFGRYAKLVRVEAAACGLHVLTRRSDYAEVWWHGSTMTDMAEKRFVCHETHPFREWQAKRAPGVSWLTLVSKKIAPKSMKLGAAKTIDLGGSICIRASSRPSLVQEGFGALPSVARALEPIRLVETQNAEATARYARFDALEDGPFNA